MSQAKLNREPINKKSHGKLLGLLSLGAVAMFAFGFALVPLYDVLCEQLGINGKTKDTASEYVNVAIDKSRTVTVELMAQVPSNMPWAFSPEKKRIQVHPGELVRTHFVADNLSSDLIVGQAVPSVSPGQGAAYLNKTECFCFNQQPIDGKSTAELPLIFFVDPALPESIQTLTLSYTLFDITASKSQGGAEQGAAR